MKTITIIGWAAQQRSVVESMTYWPDEMDVYLAIAKAASVTNLMTIEKVLVEEDVKHTIKIPVEEVLDLQKKEEKDKVRSKPLGDLPG